MNAQFTRKALLIVAAVGAVGLVGWLASTQGPLAPTRVTLARVDQGTLVASTFGIGTVEARRTYSLGPTVASRVARVLVDQGDTVEAGQLLAELDPVDLDDRVIAARIAAERAGHAVRAAQALLAEAQSREHLAAASERRFADLRSRGFVSQEAVDAKSHEANAAKAASESAAAQLASAHRDHERAFSDVAGIGKLRAQARLTSPVSGVVSARLVEPGSTVVAGQAVVQVIDPASLWIKARINQSQAGGVRVGQSASIVLRSDASNVRPGRVERVDWVSDPVTEERIVNVAFGALPAGVSIGELVEVTIDTERVADTRSVPAAAMKRLDRRDGVWRVVDGHVRFQPVSVGITTLDGRSQILDGLAAGDEVVVHSERSLKPDARVEVVAAIAGANR